MSEELRPCPFCGSEAFYIKIMGNYEKPHEIYCSKCDGAITEGRSEKQVVTNWNTRPIEDALQSRIAELEKDLSNKEIEYTDLWDDALALQARIAELEAENEKINYFFRRLRMFCIFAHWDNPNTEAEFYNVDAEIREYLSEYKVCIDQLTAHSDIERQDDKWIPEVQE